MNKIQYHVEYRYPGNFGIGWYVIADNGYTTYGVGFPYTTKEEALAKITKLEAK